MARSEGRRFLMPVVLFFCILALPPPALASDPISQNDREQGISLEVDYGLKGFYRVSPARPLWFPLTLNAAGLPSGASGTVRVTTLSCSYG